jgi:hypothetical protein
MLVTTLPVFHTSVMTPFQAFVMTPVLIMIAGLVALAVDHGLDMAFAKLSGATAGASENSTCARPTSTPCRHYRLESSADDTANTMAGNARSGRRAA